MTRSLVCIATLSTLLTACSLTDDAPNLGSSESNVDERSIEYRLRDEALELPIDEPYADEVSYGQCESVEPDNGADYQINCGSPWTEVAWYYIGSFAAEQARQAGQTTLRATFASDGLLRASIHRLQPSGETLKLERRSVLLNGDSIAAPLDEPGGYYIYVARGRSLWPVWDTDSISFEITPTFE